VARKHPLLFNGQHLISPTLAVGGTAGAGRSGATRRNSSGTRGSPACPGLRCEIGVNVSAGVVVPDSFAEKRYTSLGLVRGARRMRSYVIWLATGARLALG